ncbi:hypothetical protein [Tessaracoccus sp. ZS01]|uniref:hypothetical protein n=1 Tax=Tessaracoccus sp. ZS01 TaxID=1906324 RepID=UPI00096E9441|nr:hypothetical protein [Tessaracoccus sp. ZS01]OMG57951.1 hypothetical protein BJN44_04095 [Tessaracoccus sp. ZS01]
MRRPLIVALVTILVVGGLALAGWMGFRYLQKRITPEVCHVQVTDGSLTLSPAQARNASIIVAASVERDLPEQAAVIAIATAYQESGLRNLDYGDRDSLGLFQQRPSFGWGTEEQIMDPWYSSARFYEELVKFTNWDTTDVNDIAQKVQRSGHPDAYRKHVENSQAVVGALRGSVPASLGCISFEPDPSPAREGLDRVLEAFGSALTVEETDDGLSITATDGTTAWAAAQHAVANSYDAAVTGVTLGDRQWRAASRQWETLQTPGPELTVVVTLAG